MKIVIRRRGDYYWYWILVTAKGRRLARSGSNYTRKHDCRRAAVAAVTEIVGAVLDLALARSTVASILKDRIDVRD